MRRRGGEGTIFQARQLCQLCVVAQKGGAAMSLQQPRSQFLGDVCWPVEGTWTGQLSVIHSEETEVWGREKHVNSECGLLIC